MNKTNLEFTIGWLYPDLMSTYGDRGNIRCWQKRSEWRGIRAHVIPITQESDSSVFEQIDLLFGGGSQDREQEIVMRDLHGEKARAIAQFVEAGKPALFVCGAPQLLGKYYEPSEGKRIEGLGIFDMITTSPQQGKKRLIGNVVAQLEGIDCAENIIVGFENHGGRTILGSGAQPFARILRGYGNNGADRTEGVVYKNAVGCYFHGPLLPKNPSVADWFIGKALEKKYERKVQLARLDDKLEWEAHNAMLKRLGVTIRQD